ncbi:hypothetical protein DMB66_52050 [Actinoplanes sp. ATCC 53533]|uniref:hypothetical protein n=1 Tax=Actinoplanes sp. ATCC 53533 TaxID=1288362 RepID=UPI000F778449|nr:hypothetical protein [Actinoplanes sp. ATCC 53533]RSM44717.1 hypothetical protein DMB66_52050 [Actinoplanes sp. ATCC 53533]
MTYSGEPGGLPTGATATFSPASVTSGASSTLTRHWTHSRKADRPPVNGEVRHLIRRLAQDHPR